MVFSYYARRSRSDEPLRRPATEVVNATAERNRSLHRRWLQQIPSVVALIAIMLCIGYSLTLDVHPRVIAAEMPITNQIFLRDKQEYQDRALQILQQDLSSRFKLTINTNRIAAELRRSYPELADVSVTLPLVGRRPVITVDATRPVLILASQNNAYIVDTRGTIVMKTSDAADAAKNLPVVNDESGVPADIGKVVLPAADVQFVTGVISQLSAKQLTVQSILLPQNTHEVRMRLKDHTYYIRFNLDTDSRVAAGTFLAARQKLDTDRIKPAEYIDVRLEERAYYK